jgi:hypothetical protein
MLIPTKGRSAERKPFREGKSMTMLNTTTRNAAPAIRRGVAVFLARLGRFVDRVIAHREARRTLSLCAISAIGIWKISASTAVRLAMLSVRGRRLASGYNEFSDSDGKSALSSGVFFKDKLHGARPEPQASLKE